jgi:hypothetical protein
MTVFMQSKQNKSMCYNTIPPSPEVLGIASGTAVAIGVVPTFLYSSEIQKKTFIHQR